MTATARIGSRLARNRQARGLTLTGLAERSGIAKSTLSALENGHGNPTIDTLWGIANALNTPFGTLIAPDSNAPGDGPAVADPHRSVQLIERNHHERTVETYLMRLEAGERKDSSPHPSGVEETVTVIAGQMLVGTRSGPRLLTAGDTFGFQADTDHLYAAIDGPAKAIVCVQYPRFDISRIRSIRYFTWPAAESEWEALRTVLNRHFIEVSNGVSGYIIIFQNVTVSYDEAMRAINAEITADSSYGYEWPIMTILSYNDSGLSLAIFPKYYVSAFTAGSIPADSTKNGDILNKALYLSYLAQSPGSMLPDQARANVREHASGVSLLLSTIAAEVLTLRGEPTPPSYVGKFEANRTNLPFRDGCDHEDSFSGRIDVDQYNAYELLHPGYGRQAVAVAQSIRNQWHSQNALGAIDVGTGPGLPLIMLHEVLSNIKWEAIEPDPTAFDYLYWNTNHIKSITPRNVDFLTYEPDRRGFEVITSIGASHHFNTAHMFQKAMCLLKPGGILCIADEFLPQFSEAADRANALIRHHSAYILTVIDALDRGGAVHETNPDEDWNAYTAFKATLPKAVVAAENGSTEHAAKMCRDLYSDLAQRGIEDEPAHLVGAYARFFWLELQALVAGLDYEVERKTYPRRFADLAAMAGFQQFQHRQVYATTAPDFMGGGTHVFTFRKPTT